MTFLDLFLILQVLSLNVTELPALVMRPVETIVSAISGAWRALRKRTGVDVSPFETSTCKSPASMA